MEGATINCPSLSSKQLGHGGLVKGHRMISPWRVPWRNTPRPVLGILLNLGADPNREDARTAHLGALGAADPHAVGPLATFGGSRMPYVIAGYQ